MSVPFLTEKWLGALTDAAHSDEDLRAAAKGQSALMQMHVDDSPTLSSYFIRVSDGDVVFGSGVADGADIEARVSYETMKLLSKGELGGQAAAMTGKMDVQGDMAKMMGLGPVLEQLPRLEQQIGIDY